MDSKATEAFDVHERVGMVRSLVIEGLAIAGRGARLRRKLGPSAKTRRVSESRLPEHLSLFSFSILPAYVE